MVRDDVDDGLNLVDGDCDEGRENQEERDEVRESQVVRVMENANSK